MRVKVKGLSKKFQIGFKRDLSALGRVVSFFSGREPKKELWALKDVTLSVDSGEILGIVGENGSGKSSLLRIIAGIYDWDEGEVTAEGNIISLINLYIGLKDRLTMEENIYMCCPLFGLSLEETRKRYDSIVQFSGLKDFVNTKVYQFSQGMRQRLSFSIAVHCDPQVLLVDEVFEVGDEEFKIKSVNKIKECVKKGTAVILVTHELWMIEKYCDRAIWLHEGKVVSSGSPSSLIAEYKSGIKE